MLHAVPLFVVFHALVALILRRDRCLLARFHEGGGAPVAVEPLPGQNRTVLIRQDIVQACSEPVDFDPIILVRPLASPLAAVVLGSEEGAVRCGKTWCLVNQPSSSCRTHKLSQKNTSTLTPQTRTRTRTVEFHVAPAVPQPYAICTEAYYSRGGRGLALI